MSTPNDATTIAWLQIEIALLRKQIAATAQPAEPTDGEMASIVEDCLFWDAAPTTDNGECESCVNGLCTTGERCVTLGRDSTPQAAPAAVEAIANGYALVPIEPTEAMVWAAEKAEFRHVLEDRKRGGNDPDLGFSAVYRAMIAAAPSQPAEPVAQTAQPTFEPCAKCVAPEAKP